MDLKKAQAVVEALSEKRGRPVREFGQAYTMEDVMAIAVARAVRRATRPDGTVDWKEAAGLIVEWRRFYVDASRGAVGLPVDVVQPCGLSAWARWLGSKTGERCVEPVLWACSQSNEQMGDAFLAYIADNCLRFILDAGDSVRGFYSCDGGQYRYRVDGGEGVLAPNGWGDGSFDIVVARGRPAGRGRLVRAERSLEFADYDCGEFLGGLELPAGTYEIESAYGNLSVRKDD